MRRIVSVLAILALVSAAWRTAPAQEVVVEGAWLLASTTDTAGNVNEDPLPGLFVFTSTHYSIMYATGDGPRARYPGESPTDEERLAAYDTFIANTGSYHVDGDQLTFRAFVAKDPNYMAEWPEDATTVTIHLDGDTLQWTWGDEFAPSIGQVFTFSRVEGMPAPWDCRAVRR